VTRFLFAMINPDERERVTRLITQADKLGKKGKER